MGQTGRKKRHIEEEANTESENDLLDPFLREVARDSIPGSESPGPVSNLPKKGDIIDGKYRIDEQLSTGGMGAVFSATQLTMKRAVAIKVMLPHETLKKESVQRFRREAELAGRIDHPNVVRVYDIGQYKGGHYLVMELLKGESLSQLMEAGRVFPYHEAIALLMPVMRGVAAVHAKGVVHRDLKPNNIFLCHGDNKEQRELKVLDFGVSKLLEQNDQPDALLTTANTFLGTIYYSAPEQLDGEKRLDRRVDVYALGVILYEMITGRLPFYLGNSVNQSQSPAFQPRFTSSR